MCSEIRGRWVNLEKEICNAEEKSLASFVTSRHTWLGLNKRFILDIVHYL